MYESLEKLINKIQAEYSNISTEWNKNEMPKRIKLKNTLVKDILMSDTIKGEILAYRNYINDNIIDFTIKLQTENFKGCKINTRVKTQNSIEFKTKNYFENHENGEIPINKCFNDLFGIRIILEQNIDHKQIQTFIKEKYKNLKCINSSKKKGNYKATHVYFSINNYTFPWELQIWNKVDEENNLKSHEMYKQEYVKWEAENKGGNIYG